MSTTNSQQASMPTWSVVWELFAGAILIVNGIFSAIQGLAAMFGADTYYAVVKGDVFLFDLEGWGWFNLILGALLVVTGTSLLVEAGWARVIAIILAVISSIVQMLLLPLQPWWALIVIAINITIIFAVVVRSGELRQATR